MHISAIHNQGFRVRTSGHLPPILRDCVVRQMSVVTLNICPLVEQALFSASYDEGTDVSETPASWTSVVKGAPECQKPQLSQCRDVKGALRMRAQWGQVTRKIGMKRQTFRYTINAGVISIRPRAPNSSRISSGTAAPR